MKTLLVDGDNLLTIGFCGLKNHFYKGRHIGGIYHFMNTLRKQFEVNNLDKICVFWDGEDAPIQRQKIYSHYKDRSNKKIRTEEEENNYNFQRNRIKQYLEELYVRQGEYLNCETDDCIAYYAQNSPSEDKIIFSSDKDLLQLINNKTVLYHPSYHMTYENGDTIMFDHEEVLVDNVKILKILCGDPSDNISGIFGLGIKKIINFFPEIKTQPITIDEIINKGLLIHESNKDNKTIQNLLTGVTKYGVFGDEFFDINVKIIDLSNPFLTEEAKQDINDLINERLDTEDRSYKNTMKMMIEDGIFTFLPKYDDAWIKFLTPFLRLTAKEKNRNILKKKYL